MADSEGEITVLSSCFFCVKPLLPNEADIECKDHILCSSCAKNKENECPACGKCSYCKKNNPGLTKMVCGCVCCLECQLWKKDWCTNHDKLKRQATEPLENYLKRNRTTPQPF